MKRIVVLITCVSVILQVYGHTMSLSECIKLGISNNLKLANSMIEIEKGKTIVSQNRAKLLPVINGIIGFTDYFVSPVNVTTGVALGNNFPEDPNWQAIKSTQYNLNVGLQLVMPLYNRTIFTAIDVARTVEEISKLSYNKAVEELTMQIGKVYYLAQASKKQMELSEENIVRMEELCVITEALYEQGVVMEIDLNRVNINLQTLRTQHDNYQTLYKQHINMLQYLLDVSSDDTLDVVAVDESLVAPYDYGLSMNQPELLLAESQKKLIDKQIKSLKAGYLPSVSLSGYAGGLCYQDKFRNFFHSPTSTENWFGNCYIRLTISIPIFDANSKRLQIHRRRYEAEQAENNIALLQKQLNKNYNDALLQMRHNVNAYQTQSESRRQAESVYNITELQYKEGVASMTALLQDEMQLRLAQAACVQARCQCDMARLQLLKLSGNLSELTEND